MEAVDKVGRWYDETEGSCIPEPVSQGFVGLNTYPQPNYHNKDSEVPIINRTSVSGPFLKRDL